MPNSEKPDDANAVVLSSQNVLRRCKDTIKLRNLRNYIDYSQFFALFMSPKRNSISENKSLTHNLANS